MSFIDMMEKQYGHVTQERLVDYCICNIYAFRQRDTWNIKSIFGRAGIERLVNAKRGSKYYEDQWLSDMGLSRGKLILMISDKSVHPQAKYIYMASEEPTKIRMLNTETGYVICQTATLGWSPISETCSLCNYAEQCKIVTQKKFPELYRLRLEYGTEN